MDVLDKSQQDAVNLATDLKHRVVGIHGPAGHGKTKILREIYDDFYKRGIDVIAVAPTGKSARRIKEATGIDAMTMHRALEFPHPGEVDEATGEVLNFVYPKRCRKNPFKQTVVLADEYAMVNDEIHRALMAALPPGGVIRCFGDVNQLRPIEENKALLGKPSNFERIINGDKFPSVKLTKLYRTGKDSIIAQNAGRILLGQNPQQSENYRITLTNNPVIEISEMMKNHADIWATTDAQGISPTKKTWIGTEALNASLQHNVFKNVFASTEKYLMLERHRWSKQPVTVYVGDKIIITANNYGLGLFNGDIGKVVDIDTHVEALHVDFYGKIVTISSAQKVMFKGYNRTFNPHKDIDLAYVITTHKTQGSEWKRIAYVMNRSCSFMCDRRNFYTGTTRPREHVELITDQRALALSLWKKGD